MEKGGGEEGGKKGRREINKILMEEKVSLTSNFLQF